MKKIAVLISGSGSNLQALIDHTVNGEIDGQICCVISNRRQAYGLVRAQSANIDTYYLNSKEFIDDQAYDLKVLEILRKYAVDVVVLAGYLKILTPVLIQAYPNRIINIHPSLIPCFCGPGFYGEKVHQAVYDAGVKVTGATTHFVNELVDAGYIIHQQSVAIKPQDNVADIAAKVLKIEHQLLVMTVKAFCLDQISIEHQRCWITDRRVYENSIN